MGLNTRIEAAISKAVAVGRGDVVTPPKIGQCS